VPFSNYTAVAQAVKARGWLVYSNECIYPFTFNYTGSMPYIPDDVDIISVDIYGYGRGGQMIGDNRSGTEAAYVRSWVETVMYPRMKPHQRIMQVPGTFAAWNASRPSTSGPNGALPSPEDEKVVVDKLEEYWQWARADPRVIGINCFHWWTLCEPCNADGSPNTAVCGKAIGCVADYQKCFYGVNRMPTVIKKLQQISALIRQNTTVEHDNNARLHLKNDDATKWQLPSTSVAARPAHYELHPVTKTDDNLHVTPPAGTASWSVDYCLRRQ
jgi:hypothetical protein